MRLACSTFLFFYIFMVSISHADVAIRAACPPVDMPTLQSCPSCCSEMGGIHYCDSAAGRFVCKNGFYSSCYCSRKAVMDLQKIKGCCLWQGGVLKVDEEEGLVICNNGGISAICSLQNVSGKVSFGY